MMVIFVRKKKKMQMIEKQAKLPSMHCKFIIMDVVPVHVVLVVITLSSNDGSHEPAQMDRFTRAFAACIHKVWM